MIIKFACGCTHDVNVTGNAKTRARRAAWLAKQTCYKCEEKAFDAAADAFIAENLGELPELPREVSSAIGRPVQISHHRRGIGSGNHEFFAFYGK